MERCFEKFPSEHWIKELDFEHRVVWIGTIDWKRRLLRLDSECWLIYECGLPHVWSIKIRRDGLEK